MDVIGSLFIAESRNYLTVVYLPKLERAIAELSDEDIWWSPNEASNSIGNLLLHMSGSLRMWTEHVVAERPSDRVRSAEFEARGGVDRAELLARLRSSVADADAVLAALPVDELSEHRLVSGKDETVMNAIYHAIEHFAMHSGQIFWIVKLREARDLRLTP